MALLGNLKGSAHVFLETDFYNGVATQSLRLDGGAEITLDNAGSATSNKIATISTWFKRADETTTLAYLFHSKNDGSFGDGSNGLASFSITLDADDNISVVQYNGNPSFNANQYDFGVKTSDRKFRDLGSWYHLVVAIDTTQGSGTTNEADRIKMYINGDQQTVVAINDGSGYQDFADENQLIAVNQDGEQRWGGSVDDSVYAHVYLAETNVVDGLALDASYFGETKNGVWIAKAPNVSEYGNHGYRLQYKETSVGSGSSSTIGADTSGKNNHFTSTNVSAHDCAMPDSPENNWCTLNPLTAPGGSLEYLEGSLKITRGSVDAYSLAMSTLAVKTGKWYAELRPQGTITSNNHMVGVCVTNVKDQSSGDPYLENGQINYVAFGNGHVDDGGSINASTFSGSTSFGAGDIIGVALDLDSGTRTVKFYKNNSLVNTSSYGNLTSEFDDEHIAFMSILFGTNTCVWNFGQDSTFAGQISAGGNADENGIGDFKYAPPSGHLALCSANLPEPTIGSNSATQADDHFNTVLYTGSGSTQSITGVGFQSDWSWFKRRDATVNHALYDSIRGGTNALRSNTNGAPAQFGDAVITFQSDGFQIAGTNVSGINGSSDSMVAWNWKASGSSVTNNDGSIASTVSANTTAGFSIVKATSPSSGTWTVGHGLGATPDFIIQKYLASNSRWTVWQNTLTSGQYLGLNESNAVASSGTPFNFTFNSTVIGGNSNYDGTSTDVIYYVFKEIDGYSKFANFTGNGNADGTFVYTGFRPSWVLIKNTARSADWRLHDVARQPTNDDGGHILLPNSTSSEVTSEYDIDFLSNGFKLRSGDVYENGDGELLIYAAFAEDPFKYANAK